MNKENQKGTKYSVIPFFGRPTAGNMVAKLLPDIENNGEFINPDAKRNQWAEVVEVGAPISVLYNWFEILLWIVFKRNPSPIKKGDQVLIPKMTGQRYEHNGDIYIVFEYTKIQMYR